MVNTHQAASASQMPLLAPRTHSGEGQCEAAVSLRTALEYMQVMCPLYKLILNLVKPQIQVVVFFLKQLCSVSKSYYFIYNLVSFHIHKGEICFIFGSICKQNLSFFVTTDSKDPLACAHPSPNKKTRQAGV